MRALYLFTCMCLIGLWMASCQKDYSCENCSDTSNELPVAKAGADQVIQWPVDSILLDGSASIDPDGQLISYKWSVISGPGVPQFEDSFSIKTVVEKLVPGSYQLQLMVTDNYGAIARDTMEVKVAVSPGALPPVAMAGIDQTLVLPADSTTLDGSTSFDQDGSITTWQWIQLDGPAAANIKDIYMEHTLVTGLQEGTYHFILKITDNRAMSAEDTMQLQVLRPATTSGGFTFNLVWTCKNRCDDSD
ncbi:MAG TPA: PKD domain-containing protein, partial [Flavisolibacter sp.]|nr:PKD domain-containing protein [Flavisolibacter sp.]